MIYILCEGAENHSDYMFCKRVADYYLDSTPFCMFSSNGNRGIVNTFQEKIVPVMKENDIFILLFDSVESIKGFPVDNILDSIEYECEKTGVSFRYSGYYCFEELFLSYEGLISMFKKCGADDTYVDAVIKVKDMINKGQNYFADQNNLSVLKSHLDKPKLSTREQCSKAICYDVTSRIKNLFHITKKYVGDCWIEDCSTIVKKKKSSVKCGECTFDCANQIFSDKIADFESRSISEFQNIFNI